MATEALLVLCTAPDADVAATLARGLVEAKLAACVNLVPSVRSIYRWNGAVDDATEVQLLVKTSAARFEAVRAHLRASHPYEVPEILGIPVVAGDPDYLAWIAAETAG